MRVGPLEFWTGGDDTLPFTPTRAWAIPGPKGGRSLSDWTLTLEEPDAGTPALPLHDLKRWVLSDAPKPRALTISADRKQADARMVDPDKAVELYLRGLANRLPKDPGRTVAVLMPALDDTRRDRYRGILGRVFPKARLLSEPEMVVEYFRLVRRTLTLDPERNNVILVIDLGASTTDLTIVFSNRGGEVVGGDTTRRRASRLQAIQGTSSRAAGQWVDEGIALRLGVEGGEDERLALLEEVERAKVAVSLARTAEVRGKPLARGLLESMSLELVAELEPEVATVRRRLWEQVTGTSFAAELSEAVRQERGVSGEADALTLVDHVLLAGGTSRLPGFRQAIEALVGSAAEIHEVGESFAVAASVGALAHVLRSKHEPTRLRFPGEDRTVDEPAEPTLEGGLEVDIELEWRQRPRGPSKRAVVLGSGDPLVYTPGTRENVVQLQSPRGETLKARLVPNGQDSEVRKGRGMHELRASRRDPEIGVVVDAGRRVRLHSPGLDGISSLWLDLNHFDMVRERLPDADRFNGDVPDGSVAFDRADEVVIDFGMSKSVFVSAGAGLLRPEALDAACAGRSLPARVAPVAAPRETVANDTLVAVIATEQPQDRHERDASEEPTKLPAVVDAPEPEHGASEVSAYRWADRLEPEEFGEQLRALEEPAKEADLPLTELVIALMALSVREIVLLAGPPGCGKSTLVRAVAHVLGLASDGGFVEVRVRPHWGNDRPLFGKKGRLKELNRDVLVLFDEFNLARPEYYLGDMLHEGPTDDRPCWRAFGTLNIDETSRPPSPKVLDRCFLLEFEQADWSFDRRSPDLGRLPRIGGLSRIPTSSRSTDDWIDRAVDALSKAVAKEGLRQDLLPSRRVGQDIHRMLALWEAAGLDALVSREELVDRLIASRILVKLTGPYEQVKPVLDALEPVIDVKLRQSSRRLAIARKQELLGFVSPWN